MPPYKYQELRQSEEEIRLLELLPNNGNDKLKKFPSCRIIHASLQKKREYTALSYVWDDSGNSRLILLENYSVKVTKNLYDAMMALRPAAEPLVIWIDSLCINQSDTKEKSWQVGLMRDIYRQAHNVIAWLGPADESSDSVMDYLDDLGRRAEACGLANGPEDCIKL
ncbi:hypothetical protein EK21DRAFT_55520 [Setomelanomma holmii]|uniref:Heterokaryon incompatibility domain-containing protein n=1 Tax=Setomelanomma holmii TaxID=210430 RepID=A0A9P4HIM7_9PLEO|nr:hypothetical protein EK21DRAFT_55520 [Setomelanomma holmii]